MAAGATVFRDTVISVVPTGVRVMSQHYVVADGGFIRGSLISVILTGVPLTWRKFCRCRRQSHPPQRCIVTFGGEVNPSVLCRSFTACKISLNVMWKSTFRQNLPDISRPQFHLPLLGALAW
jgi:hypothetical protein